MRKGDIRDIEICGDTFTLRYLGKGTFWQAWEDMAGETVYLSQKLSIGHDDQSKEAIWLYANMDNPHVPDLERICVEDDGKTWFKSTKYQPLTKRDNPEAYGHFKIIEKYWDTAWKDHRNHIPFMYKGIRRTRPDGRTMNYDVLTGVMTDERLPEELRWAVKEIIECVENYGDEYCLEFAKRNLKVDDEGRLVLVDVVYNWRAYFQRREMR